MVCAWNWLLLRQYILPISFPHVQKFATPVYSWCRYLLSSLEQCILLGPAWKCSFFGRWPSEFHSTGDRDNTHHQCFWALLSDVSEERGEVRGNLPSLNLTSPLTFGQSFLSLSWLWGKGRKAAFFKTCLYCVCLWRVSGQSWKKSLGPTGIV